MSISAAARPSWSDGASFAPVTLKLAPGEAKEVAWPAEVPTGLETATWEAQVKEENGNGADNNHHA